MAGIFKRKVVRPVREATLYVLLQIALFSLRLFPRPLVLFIHEYMAVMFFLLLASTRKRVLRHLTLVYGSIRNRDEIYLMGRNLFINLGKTFTDYIIFSRLTTRSQFNKYFTIEGEEHLQAAYAKGKGVLCLIPHTCGWEFSAIMPPVFGYETSAVSREIRMKALNKIMIHFREKRGMKNISRCSGNTYHTLKEVLGRGECLIIMIDQDSKRVRGEFLKFFGMDAYTPLGCAQLAIETEAVIVPMATYRLPGNKYLFKILPEVPLQLSDDPAHDLRYNTQIHNNILESLIREHPEQWVWMHKRWNTTPQLLEEHLKQRAKNASHHSATSAQKR
ncbi:lysophospholipid acyltransferase family protein [Parabacteroides sp. OttesenSCG-928-G06]|nr:lysophospholipid acyltransferase family protein [Parabacteroides sp. OttesenSCG-928-K15]MDL2282013.1 lysophospholipid acyltransferase family protein [Parabacteroides sp. OttesenSCG-928-G06]